MTTPERVTQILIDWKNGNRDSVAMLTTLVYDELRVIARRYLTDERAAATLQPTALVHEAYLRLVSQSLPDWESRGHFFGIAAHLMRQILVDRARRNRSAKRGGGIVPVPLEDALSFAPEKASDTLALDDALTELARLDPRKCQVIEMRFFGGLSVEETATALGISVATVGREQRLAEAWLHRELNREAPEFRDAHT